MLHWLVAKIPVFEHLPGFCQLKMSNRFGGFPSNNCIQNNCAQHANMNRVTCLVKHSIGISRFLSHNLYGSFASVLSILHRSIFHNMGSPQRWSHVVDYFTSTCTKSNPDSYQYLDIQILDLITRTIPFTLACYTVSPNASMWFAVPAKLNL